MIGIVIDNGPSLTTPLSPTNVPTLGGSNGIGASLTELCCSNTSYVCIGDIDDTAGEALARRCQDRWPAISDPNQPPKPPRASFRHVDVTDYQSVVDFFEFAFTTYKRIDHVVVTAGSMATGDNWFDQSLSFKTVREASFPFCPAGHPSRLTIPPASFVEGHRYQPHRLSLCHPGGERLPPSQPRPLG